MPSGSRTWYDGGAGTGPGRAHVPASQPTVADTVEPPATTVLPPVPHSSTAENPAASCTRSVPSIIVGGFTSFSQTWNVKAPGLVPAGVSKTRS